MRTAEFDRDHVIDLAMHVFWEKGYDGASIDDLSRATGLNRSSIYNTFSGKRALYLTTLRRYHARRSEVFAELEASPQPVTAIRRLVHSVVTEELGNDNALGCMMANAALEFAGADPEVAALTAYNLTTMAAAIESAIRRAQTLGQVAESADPTAVSRVIVTTIQGLRVTAKAIAPDDRVAWFTAAVDNCLAPLTIN